MKLQPQTIIAAHFADIEDPRIDRSKDHLLIDILTIAILAKLGIKNKRLRAGWDDDYLLKVLAG
jgi:hypothetical protein